MKWNELIASLAKMAEEDGELNEEVSTADVLDYMGTLGIPGASDAYIDLIAKNGK